MAGKSDKSPTTKASKKASVQNEDRIKDMSHEKLVHLWEQITSEHPPAEWQSGKALEYLIVRAFALEGATVTWPYHVNFPLENTGARGFMEQIDGAVHINTHNLSVLIESKDDKDAKHGKGIDPIAKLRNQLLRRPAGVIGAIFSLRGFTYSAKTLAHFMAPQTVLLWEREDLARALSKKKMCEGMVAKYRHAVEMAIPNYNLALEGW